MVDRTGNATGRRRDFLLKSFAAVATVAAAPGALRAQPTVPPMSGAAAPELSSFDTLLAGFVRQQKSPGAAFAMTSDSRLVYARGFGFADRQRHEAVQPDALFRIASISKPITAVAILQLAERGKFSLDAKVWELLGLAAPTDVRWTKVTVRHLLHHVGGWDRDAGFDPMFRSAIIVKALGVPPPAGPAHVIRYMLEQPLDFDPGSRFAYSNFGYCLLGRVVEHASGLPYEQYVQQQVLAPLGIRRMRLDKTLPAQRSAGEVVYHATDDERRPAVMGPIVKPVPMPYGAWSIEAMDSHGGWLAAAPDLVRFASALDNPETSRILNPASISTMFARPDGVYGQGNGDKRNGTYYACGWWVRALGRGRGVNAWHTGSLDGTSTLLVRRHDRKNWAALFNARNSRDGERLSDKVDPLIHTAVDRIRYWPSADMFDRML